MKISKTRRMAVGLATVTLTGVISICAARAGSKQSKNVVVTLGATTSTASGSLATARNSTDTAEGIGCTISTNMTPTGSSTELFCSAASNRSLTGGSTVRGSCETEDPALISIAESLRGDSFLTFSWNSEDDCTSIKVENYSYAAPKLP